MTIQALKAVDFLFPFRRVIYLNAHQRCRGWSKGRNEMDPPLCGSAVISQNDFKTSETIQPQEASPMKKLSVVGIDIAKQVFHLVGMDEHGTILVRKRLYRAQVMAFIAQLPPMLIGMEACGGAHYWARRFREHGHEVKLMAPQFVKPYV